jgi:hypothetical protein
MVLSYLRGSEEADDSLDKKIKIPNVISASQQIIDDAADACEPKPSEGGRG